MESKKKKNGSNSLSSAIRKEVSGDKVMKKLVCTQNHISAEQIPDPFFYIDDANPAHTFRNSYKKTKTKQAV